MTKQIPLNNKRGEPLYVLVDDSDYPELSRYKWHLFAGHYAGRTGHICMHRQILNAPSHASVDHIDGNGLNNTRANLRLVTQSQNNMNARPRQNSTSRYKGVYWNKYHQKWYARIHVNGRGIYLGRYATQREAALAYNEAAKQHFGEYARLNELVDDPGDIPVAEPRPPKTARYRGVCWDKGRNAWNAKIQVNQHTLNLGRFPDELEAAKAYDEAARTYHGEKAKLNFPD